MSNKTFVQKYLPNFHISTISSSNPICFSAGIFAQTYQNDNPFEFYLQEYKRKAIFIKNWLKNQELSKLSTFLDKISIGSKKSIINLNSKTSTNFLKMVVEEKILKFINKNQWNRTLCPSNYQCQIISINSSTPTIEAYESIKNANCLIISQIENLFFSAFSKTKLNFIEVEPNNRINSNYGKSIANHCSLNYIAIHVNSSQSNPKCSTLECALQNQDLCPDIIPILSKTLFSIYK